MRLGTKSNSCSHSKSNLISLLEWKNKHKPRIQLTSHLIYPQKQGFIWDVCSLVKSPCYRQGLSSQTSPHLLRPFPVYRIHTVLFSLLEIPADCQRFKGRGKQHKPTHPFNIEFYDVTKRKTGVKYSLWGENIWYLFVLTFYNRLTA